jgi:hypothetical protein
MLMSLLAATVAGFSMTPTVADSGATSPKQVAEAAGNPNTVVCRVVPAPTGTMLGGRRECRTAREWVAIHHDAARQVDDAQQTADQLGNN